MATSRNPTAIRADSETGSGGKSHIVPQGVAECFVRLQPGTHSGGFTSVVPAWLFEIRQQFEALEVVSPDAQGPCSGASADGLMARVSSSPGQ